MAIILNKRLSSDYGVVIENRLVRGVAARATSQHQIAGTNRIIVEDLGYYLPRKMELNFHVRAKTFETISAIDKFRAWYGTEISNIRMEDTLEPNFYWKVFKDSTPIDMQMNYEEYYFGKITLHYNGLNYLKEGEIKNIYLVDNNITEFNINNNTFIESYPIINLKFNNSNNINNFKGTLNIINNNIKEFIRIEHELKTNSTIVLDFEKRLVYQVYMEDNIEVADRMVYSNHTVNFFKLPPGVNTIEWVGNDKPTEMSIIPRWAIT